MLQLSEIKEILKNPSQKQTINQAVQHELRLKFHSEAILSQNLSNLAATKFLNWVSTLIPNDKFEIFCQLFRYPIKTLSFTDKIYKALEKIFDGQNPVFQYEFQSDELAQDWNKYRASKLKEPNVWQNKGFATMKTAINSVLIVDVPKEQTTERPEPYFYFLDISSVIDFKESDGRIEWIIFRQSDDVIAVFDNEFCRLFKTKSKSNELQDLIFETSHGLGYCPAKFFWSKSLTSNSSIKQSPISTELSDLDWLLFFSISKQHLDLYAPYPIYSGFESDCDYENEQTGEYCDNGFIKQGTGSYVITSNGALHQCPACSKKRIAGVGSFIEIPVPSVENDMADLRNPVSITTIDKDSLEYNVQEVERLKSEIFENVTGYSGELTKNKAVNEKQVTASFEARKNILVHLKKNFEDAQKWTTETICKLRYGSMFVSCSIDYGTSFYLESEEHILSEYNEAKKNGLDDTILDILQNQYYSTKFKNNPEQQQRIKVLLNLDPFRHLSKSEVREMYQNGQIGYDDMIIKNNFSSFVMRFERENINILEFGSATNFDSKIKSIYDAFKGYANEISQGIQNGGG